jgi:hypothetical protein
VPLDSITILYTFDRREGWGDCLATFMQRNQQALASLRGLASLAHLELPTSNAYEAFTPGIIQELGGLTNQASLKLDLFIHSFNLTPVQLAPLANLVHLTRLDFGCKNSYLAAEQGLVLAELSSLVELCAGFIGAAAAVAALRPLQGRLQLIDIDWLDVEDDADALPQDPLPQPRGELRLFSERLLRVFDLCRVRVLDVCWRGERQRLLAPALAVCSQLQSLQICCCEMERLCRLARSWKPSLVCSSCSTCA